jgi:hypothetical protein
MKVTDCGWKQSIKDLPQSYDMEGNPRYQALDAAVTRLTEAAKSEGRNDLIMTTHGWKKLILSARRGGFANLAWRW